MTTLKTVSLALPILGGLFGVALAGGNRANAGLDIESLTPSPLAAQSALASLSGIAVPEAGGPNANLPTFIGLDTNSALNPFIQPQDPALAGNGRDQTQQFFDLVFGHWRLPSVVIGRLGTDLLIGGPDVDVIIGGTEHFNPANRDKAYGLDGDDVFLWSPGDGSDLFEGGPGLDTLVFGLMGEVNLQTGQVEFKVHTDQQSGYIHLDPVTGLPSMDVTNSPGFCEIIDSSSSPDAATELKKINADHLARFVIRSVADSFAAGQQTTDNGLRVTLTLRDVEYLVCADRDGGDIEAFDMRWSPARKVPLSQLPQTVNWIVR